MASSERKGAESTNIYISENPDGDDLAGVAEPNCFTSSFVDDGDSKEVYGGAGLADKIETAAYGSQVSETLQINSAAVGKKL